MPLAACWRHRQAEPLLEAGIRGTGEMFDLMKGIGIPSGPARSLWTSVMAPNARTFEMRYFKEYAKNHMFGF